MSRHSIEWRSLGLFQQGAETHKENTCLVKRVTQRGKKEDD